MSAMPRHFRVVSPLCAACADVPAPRGWFHLETFPGRRLDLPQEPTMKISVCLVPVVLLLAACASAPAGPAVDAPATRHDAAIPWADIKTLLNPAQQHTLADLPDSGYVVMDGWIQADGTIKVHRVLQSFPDHVRDQLARAYGGNAVVHVETSGSQIAMAAEVYVVFYHTDLEGDIALTFARKRGATGTGQGDYLNIARF
jgi:hypothetical protein